MTPFCERRKLLKDAIVANRVGDLCVRRAGWVAYPDLPPCNSFTRAWMSIVANRVGPSMSHFFSIRISFLRTSASHRGASVILVVSTGWNGWTDLPLCR